MAYLLLIAGFTTTVHFIGNALLLLLQDDTQCAALRSGTAPIEQAVEELLRYAGPVELATWRFTREAVRLGEVSIPAGEPVLVRVEAIFRPMCPDFPTPRTTTLPRASTQALIRVTALEKFGSSRSRKRWSSKISISRTRRAFSR